LTNEKTRPKFFEKCDKGNYKDEVDMDDEANKMSPRLRSNINSNGFMKFFNTAAVNLSKKNRNESINGLSNIMY